MNKSFDKPSAKQIWFNLDSIFSSNQRRVGTYGMKRGREASNLFIPGYREPGIKLGGRGIPLKIDIGCMLGCDQDCHIHRGGDKCLLWVEIETPSPTLLLQLPYFIAEAEVNLLMDHDGKAQLREDMRKAAS